MRNFPLFVLMSQAQDRWCPHPPVPRVSGRTWRLRRALGGEGAWAEGAWGRGSLLLCGQEDLSQKHPEVFDFRKKTPTFQSEKSSAVCPRVTEIRPYGDVRRFLP